MWLASEIRFYCFNTLATPPTLTTVCLEILRTLKPCALSFWISFVFVGTDPLGFILNSYGGRDFTMSERVLSQLRVVCHYLSLIFFPVPSRLSIEYEFPVSTGFFEPVTTVLAAIVLAGFMLLPVFFGKRRKLTLFAVAWFFLNLATESSVIALEMVFEHRVYLPSMPCCVRCRLVIM